MAHLIPWSGTPVVDHWMIKLQLHSVLMTEIQTGKFFIYLQLILAATVLHGSITWHNQQISKISGDVSTWTLMVPLLVVHNYSTIPWRKRAVRSIVVWHMITNINYDYQRACRPIPCWGRQHWAAMWWWQYNEDFILALTCNTHFNMWHTVSGHLNAFRLKVLIYFRSISTKVVLCMLPTQFKMLLL
jgi:hypothetical protein